MKILKHAKKEQNKKYIKTCVCGCVFEFDEEEIIAEYDKFYDIDTYYCIYCPDCGKIINVNKKTK